MLSGLLMYILFTLTWYTIPRKKQHAVFTRGRMRFTNEALSPEQFEWLRQRLETMHKVFAPIVKNLQSNTVG